MASRAHPFTRVVLSLTGALLVLGSISESTAEQMISMTPIVVTIEEKSVETNKVFAEKRAFRVPLGTPILDRRKRNITLKELSVPCRAEIQYKLGSSREPVVSKIQIK